MDVDPIRQDHIGNGTPVLVLAACLKRDFLPVDQDTSSEAACFARLPKACPFSGQSMALSRMRLALPLCRTSMVSPSRTETTGPVVKSSANAEWARRTCSTTTQTIG
jgi:hypothetical protein